MKRYTSESTPILANKDQGSKQSTKDGAKELRDTQPTSQSQINDQIPDTNEQG